MISNEAGNYNKPKFDAVIRAYTESVDISKVSWDAVLGSSFDGMLGWLEYSIKRALGMEGADSKERQEGMWQAKGTLCELRKYENQIGQLRDWLKQPKAQGDCGRSTGS